MDAPPESRHAVNGTPEAAGSSIRLLWSGGWDSTFRLLQLLLEQRRSVEPHYLVDPKRSSVPIELETMDAIRSRLSERYPDTRNLLCPSCITNVDDVPPDDEIQRSFLHLVADWNIGSQYGWIAWYCKYAGLTGVEMGLERPALGGFRLSGRLLRHSRPVSDGPVRIYEIAPEFRNHDVGVVFRYFRFPLFDLWKTEMEAIADERGWRDIMELTWFCHSPVNGRTPCGLCAPCTHTIKVGMQRRVPLRRRLRYYATPHGMRFILKDRPRLYAAARKLYRVRHPFPRSTAATLPPARGAVL
jgi:hypothetical protein